MICHQCKGKGQIEVKTIYPIFFMPHFAKVEVRLISCPNCEEKADGEEGIPRNYFMPTQFEERKNEVGCDSSISLDSESSDEE